MDLVGQALKNCTTPVLGIAPWGVLTGRRKILCPSVSDLAKENADAAKAKQEVHALHLPCATLR